VSAARVLAWLSGLLLLGAALGPAPAWAGVRRFAVLVGNNEGAPGMHMLYFAEDDALKMEQVLTTAGGYEPGDVRVLLNERRSTVQEVMVEIREDIARAKVAGDETLFLFYYSGHADDSRLQLGSSYLQYEILDGLIERSGADVRLAFLDACQSGAMTGTKGGKRAPSFVFDVTERLGASGQVVITSSSSDEASQESDEIGGSYFTHFLTSGLLGAADGNADQRVTLEEAYQYVYHETVYRTAGSRSGTQHPTYEWDLAGQGDVVLTDLSAARTTLVFPQGMQGSYAIFDRGQRMFVAEVDMSGLEQKLSLHPGTYLVQRRHPTYLEVAQVRLDEGAEFRMSDAGFEAVEYEEDVARGAIDKKIRQANLPRLSVRLNTGVLRAANLAVEQAYLPIVPAAGAGARFAWRGGSWVAADLTTGTGTSTLVIPELAYELPQSMTTLLVGAWGGWATRPRRFQVGFGGGVNAVYMHRSFPETSLDPQQLFTVAPGGAVWLGWHPGRFELDLELRNYFVPYQLDDVDQWLRFNILQLSFGYRF
jgi:hypothetical protein